MISDGILPSNEGRGYVLRRLLRRAVRHGRILGVKKPFMTDLAKVVIKLNKSHYTELFEKQDMILNVLKAEEDKFNQTIDQGLEILNQMLPNVKNNTLSGDDAFKLYDTYGFPLDLTKEILEEKNIKVDEDRFNVLMKEQKVKAREARKESNYMGKDITVFDELPKDMSSKFVGYDHLNGNGKIISIVSENKIVDKINENEEGVIITDETTFYPMMGGQAGDIGTISLDNATFEVYDTIKIQNTKIGHIGKVISGSFTDGNVVKLEVDTTNRHLTAINHTSTHLLQAALREVLGKHVEQAGSLVEYNRLRFDFTHFKPLSKEEINEVERIVNEKINEAIGVVKKEMPISEAKKEGAMALFGEKYGDIVRTVRVSDFSFELCGGTHIDNTSEIKCFKILSETGVAAGIRRIEAITSDTLLKYYNDESNVLSDISTLLKVKNDESFEKVNGLLKDIKDLKSQIETLKKQLSSNETSDIKTENIKGLNVVIDSFDGKDIAELKDIVDSIKDKTKDYVVVAFAKNDSAVDIVVSLSDTAVSKGLHAGNILKQCANALGGNGGGKDKFAQGKGKDASKLADAMKLAKDLISG